MSDEPEVLGINVNDGVKTDEVFGQVKKGPPGVAGTLHLHDINQKTQIMDAAIQLNQSTGLPAVIVVKTR